MCHSSTTGNTSQAARLLLVLLAGVVSAFAQGNVSARIAAPDWRPIGGTAFDASLASLATGQIERVWFDGGDRLYARTASGRTFLTEDRERWQAVSASPDPEENREYASLAAGLPEAGAKVSASSSSAATIYALGNAVYRSEDGGRSWFNLTDFRSESIIGDGLKDLAVSPNNDDEIVAAGRFGVWRSADGGYSWSGLNDSLPNLPVRHLAAAPEQGRGMRLLLEGLGEYEWSPGEKTAWRATGANSLSAETETLMARSAAVGEPLTAVASEGNYLYAGADSGRLWASSDGGGTWRSFQVDGAGTVAAIHVVSGSPAVALAVFGPGSSEDSVSIRVLKTTNAGLFWDDLTADLPDAAAHGITADPASGSVYVATDAGLFFTTADLRGASTAANWTHVTGNLTDEPVQDVRLDAAANQLYVAVRGEGVYAAMAPHRLLLPSIVSAADMQARAAAPGGLLSVLGRSVQTASADSLDVPILAASDGESQIQVPFEVAGSALSLALTTTVVAGESGGLTMGLPLLESSPAIFVDRDGSPMVLDADSGVLLDAMTPARPGSRVQILATGLGRVDPAWPSGMPAPIEDPPSVRAPVFVFLDRIPIEVERATLAPGYVGFYLVEFFVPDIVNTGPAELYIESGGNQSNRTRIYLEP
jgi:uncharacterized protein (TIGR03437 family)